MNGLKEKEVEKHVFFLWIIIKLSVLWKVWLLQEERKSISAAAVCVEGMPPRADVSEWRMPLNHAAVTLYAPASTAAAVTSGGEQCGDSEGMT